MTKHLVLFIFSKEILLVLNLSFPKLKRLFKEEGYILTRKKTLKDYFNINKILRAIFLQKLLYFESRKGHVHVIE